jgi:hypothetical protein
MAEQCDASVVVGGGCHVEFPPNTTDVLAAVVVADDELLVEADRRCPAFLGRLVLTVAAAIADETVVVVVKWFKSSSTATPPCDDDDDDEDDKRAKTARICDKTKRVPSKRTRRSSLMV